MAGEFSHIINQLYNFEVQFHSGVPLCEIWEEARITDIGVAATSKVWDIPPDKVIFSNVNDFALKTRTNINLHWLACRMASSLVRCLATLQAERHAPSC